MHASEWWRANFEYGAEWFVVMGGGDSECTQRFMILLVVGNTRFDRKMGTEVK